MISKKTLARLGAAAVVGALWGNGRHVRASWSPAPDIEIMTKPGRETNVITVMFAGSFVQPAEAAHGLLDHLLEYGDIMLVKYSLLRYTLGLPAKTAFDHLPHRYDTALVLGGSLGGREAQRFAVMLLEGQRVKEEDLLLIGSGVPDGPDCLPPTARISPYIHPGPLTNLLLSRIVVNLWFKIVPEHTWSPGTSHAAMEANVKAMRRHKLSVIGDQITACGKRDDATNFDRLKNVQSLYILTGTDKVVRQGTCALRWRDKLPQTFCVYAAKVGHVSWAEHPDWWWDALREGLDHFGIKPITLLGE